MSYMDIIKAKRAELDAHNLAEALEKERQRQACIDAFKEFRDAWAEVADLKVPNYKSSPRKGEEMVPFTEHLSDPNVYKRDQEKMAKVTYFSFYISEGYGGNTGPGYLCRWDEDSGQVVFEYTHRGQPNMQVSKTEMLDRFLKFLASRL